MNATERITLELGIPACIAKREPDAVYMWCSMRRLIILKDGDAINLSADDIRALARFVAGCNVDAQV